MNSKLVERFWQRIDRRGGDECWPWKLLDGREHIGHGKLYFGDGATRGFVYVHRLSFELHNGPILEGMYVCHTCDNPPCCNPAHLFLGTHQDNVRDAVSKRIHAFGERSALVVVSSKRCSRPQPQPPQPVAPSWLA